MRLPVWIVALFVALIACFGEGRELYAQVGIPTLTERVTDTTGTLSYGEIQQLDAKLGSLEAQKGAQVAVLLVPTTQPETIEQYSMRVVEAWRLGRYKVDDGVLILLAMEDRAIRIEVGYGLEGAISDAVASRIIREIMTPELRSGNTFGALDGAVNAIAKVIAGEELPAPSSGFSGNYQDVPFWILFFPFLVGDIIRSIFGRMVGGGITFLAASLAGAFLGVWFIGIVVGLIAGLIVAFASPMRGRRRGGYYGGYSSSGGGGFRGGGGSFGGGGASGRW